MTNIYSDDDDIFEDYVESSSQSSIGEVSSTESIDKVFSEVDTPFASLIKTSNIKIGFGEAFYGAAKEWVLQGYREANSIAVLDHLSKITDGHFLFHHRLLLCKESIDRKKTILHFLNLVFENDSTDTIIKGPNSMNITFTETYFHMFFKSYYNVLLDTYYSDIALYKTLCEMTNVEFDNDVYDITKIPTSISMSDHVNNLYTQYFKDTNLVDVLNRNMDEVFSKKPQ